MFLDELDRDQLKIRLDELAKEISSGLARLDSTESRELLSDFVSELYFAAADQRRREERRQRQAECIAAAKAKGVRFGRPSKPLPDNFDEIYQAWRGGEITLTLAASSCGMTRSSFCSAAERKEQAGACAV